MIATRTRRVTRGLAVMHERNVQMQTLLRIGELVRLAALRADSAGIELSVIAPAVWSVDAGGVASTPQLHLPSGDWHLLCVRPGQAFWIGAIEVRIVPKGSALRIAVSGAHPPQTEADYQLAQQAGLAAAPDEHVATVTRLLPRMVH
jgi:hypothetical protein